MSMSIIGILCLLFVFVVIVNFVVMIVGGIIGSKIIKLLVGIFTCILSLIPIGFGIMLIAASAWFTICVICIIAGVVLLALGVLFIILGCKKVEG